MSKRHVVERVIPVHKHGTFVFCFSVSFYANTREEIHVHCLMWVKNGPEKFEIAHPMVSLENVKRSTKKHELHPD